MKEQSNVTRATNSVTTVLLFIYLIILFWILLFKLGVHFSYSGERRVSLIPFRQHVVLTGENILNVVIFVPLGLYVGVLFQRWTFAQKLGFFFLLSLLVEGLQYLLRVGAFDVSDLITNTSGAVIGWLIYKAVEKLSDGPARAQRLINWFAAAGTVVMIVLLVLLKMNRLPVRYQ